MQRFFILKSSKVETTTLYGGNGLVYLIYDFLKKKVVLFWGVVPIFTKSAIAQSQRTDLRDN